MNLTKVPRVSHALLVYDIARSCSSHLSMSSKGVGIKKNLATSSILIFFVNIHLSLRCGNIFTVDSLFAYGLIAKYLFLGFGSAL